MKNSKWPIHKSDCAVSCEPAFDTTPCDCGAVDDFTKGESVQHWEKRTGCCGVYHTEALHRLHDQCQRMFELIDHLVWPGAKTADAAANEKDWNP